jgi:RsiW-degrading membrane proteinase PrsW (M82 family)
MTSNDPTSTIHDYTASAGLHPAPPEAAPAEVAQEAATATRSALTDPPPRRGRAAVVLGVIGVVLAALALLLVTFVLLVGLGPGAFLLGGILALVPLAIVFFVVRWIDRWEPEPRLAVIFAFLWGAGVSVLLTLIVGAEIDNAIASAGGTASEFFGAAVQAPIVEEVGKGLGLLLLLWVARKHFDGPVDGLVYAAWVAGGFAFTENILYFGSQLIEGGGSGVYEIFLVRGLLSPFAHVMFTACVGLALGFAARVTGPIGAIGFFVLGLIPAIALHAFWNGALFFIWDFYGYYFVVQVPLFLMAVGIVVMVRRQEAKLTHDRLAEYAAAGWFHPDEVSTLATPAGRRRAIAWARGNGRGPQMVRYIKDATRLAFARQRIITGRGRPAAQADEAALLAAVVASRHGLAA